jgi:hypothetical protein
MLTAPNRVAGRASPPAPTPPGRRLDEAGPWSRTRDLHPIKSRPCRTYTKHWTRAASWSWKMDALTRRGLVNAVVTCREVTAGAKVIKSY